MHCHCLQEMSRGLQEVLPLSAFSGPLTAEDLRLILCGCPHIDIDILRGITVFDDESRKYISNTIINFVALFMVLSTLSLCRQGDGCIVSIQGLVLGCA